MSDEFPYSDEELNRYFEDPNSRRNQPLPPPQLGGRGNNPGPSNSGRLGSGYMGRFFSNPSVAQAAQALGVVLLLMIGVGIIGAAMLLTVDESNMPSLQQLENPNLQLATIAYTADGEELARYARQNRYMVTYDEISPHVITALLSTEDHRFHDHWGIDLYGFVRAVASTLMGDRQGGSTITMQLARNLYNEEIGRAITIRRKVKEMLTAVQLERRYTKREIVEMYLNTVEFGYNAFGIEAAARTFFNKKPSELNEMESATLVGLLKGITYYNPLRNPENAQNRRNQVLQNMVLHGFLSDEFYEANKELPVETDHNPNEITTGPAPYFAEYVRNWLGRWGKENGHDIYAEGLVVYTTLNSEMQAMAQAAVEARMPELQQVVDYEWSRRRANEYPVHLDLESYAGYEDFEPWGEFWKFRGDTLLPYFIRESAEFASIKNELGTDAAIDSLKRNEEFMETLRAEKTRLEAGLVSMNPRTGHIVAWVGGRNLADDWYDHVAIAKRQPGSTFKPFVYIAAVGNGYSPEDVFPDTTCYWQDDLGNEWEPANFDNELTGELWTLRQALKKSRNVITCHLVLAIRPSTAAFYAERMGIKSPLNAVPSLALGTSNVTLLELTNAYSTLANHGLKHEPTVVTRIEDRLGNVLYEAQNFPEEALNDQVAYKVLDMMREVVSRGGTGVRIRNQYGLYEYDFAGKTGTTQNGADGWFVLMHPELVTGAWVGFNDPRVRFRTSWWGQGAHNALFLVGDYTKQMADSSRIGKMGTADFPLPDDFALRGEEDELLDGSSNRISW